MYLRERKDGNQYSANALRPVFLVARIAFLEKNRGDNNISSVIQRTDRTSASNSSELFSKICLGASERLGSFQDAQNHLLDVVNFNVDILPNILWATFCNVIGVKSVFISRYLNKNVDDLAQGSSARPVFFEATIRECNISKSPRAFPDDFSFVSDSSCFFCFS